MTFWESVSRILSDWQWVIIAVGFCLLVLGLTHWALFIREWGSLRRIRRQVLMLVLTFLAVTFLVLAWAAGERTKDSAAVVVSLLGLIVGAAVTIASTTFTSNLMAGLMLRSVRNFRIGDFVHVGDHFGAVTERGLFHIEIQTEDRDLATLPNLYLVSHPTTVVRASGTIISATVSLGYDISHRQVTSLLEQAAQAAELADPFVYVLDLGDFSITYRVAGFLRDVKHLLSTRSRLRTCMLDSLHGADIEIVSPTFMNQRRIGEIELVIPRGGPTTELRDTAQDLPEKLMFDKAIDEERLEFFRYREEKIQAQIKDVESQLVAASDDERGQLENQLRGRRTALEAIRQKLADCESSKTDTPN